DSANQISRDFIISPDSVTVVYAARLEGDGRFRLYRAPLGGGGGSILAEEVGGLPLAFAGSPEMVGPDRVFYRGGFASGASHFIAVSLATEISELLSPDVSGPGFNREDQLSPDGQYAVYAATSAKGVMRVYSVPFA